jgi:outer membrane protein assembly factor BamB
MIGVALESGEVLWETPNPGNWEMSHSSVMPMTFHGQRMYVYSAVGGTAGIAADGDTRGDILWKTDQWNHSVISPSPVRLGGEKFLVTAGYGAGSKIFEVVRTQSGFDVEERMQLDKSRFACEQHTPIYYNGLLYSVLPSDGGALNRRLVCMTPGGETVWTSDREPRFGLGPFIIADGKIFVLDDDGMMSIVEASRERFVPLDRARVLGGRESWAPIAVAGGRMLVRDFETMVCLDMRKDRDA